MMIIDWLPTGDGRAAVPLPLADVRDVAMAVDLAEAIVSAARGHAAACAGFAVKDANGAILYLSTHAGAAACPVRPIVGAASDKLPTSARPAIAASKSIAVAEAEPAPASVSVEHATAAGAGPSAIALPPAGQPFARAQASKPIQQPPSGPALTRPLVADLRILTASDLVQAAAVPSILADLSASAQAALASVAGAGRASGAALAGTFRRISAPTAGDSARRRAALVPPPSLEGETMDATSVARKLGVGRLVAAAETPAERRAFAGQIDYWILGAAAALLLFVGSPIYSIYATMSQVKAAEGRVLGSDIDVAHLRGSLQEDAAPARLAEGRSVAHDARRVRRVGMEIPAPAGVVAESLGVLARGPAFATVSTGERIDFRKLFWHLRFVSSREIAVRLYDLGDSGPQKTLIFRRGTFWSWKLFEMRTDRDA